MASIERIYTDIVKASVKDISAVQSESTLSFVFITDLHHRQGGNMLRTTQMIQEITELMRLDFILCGGDISINGPKSEVVAAQKVITTTTPSSTMSSAEAEVRSMSCTHMSRMRLRSFQSGNQLNSIRVIHLDCIIM
ncbi:hypothetical protein PMSD_15955 [Paenibacillus macquariensis subsp. defensor]|nr:hypothetical protein PMSD_15955 [Paenibacillus macquariensis subsp. defensor]